MNTPTPNPAEAFREELRTRLDKLEATFNARFNLVHEELDALRQELEELKDGIKAAASQPAAPAGNQAGYTDFTAETILLTYNDNGDPAYKLKGGNYTKFGVRVWPEVLPALGIKLDDLKPGPNPLTPPVKVRAVLNDKGQPRKVSGKSE